MISISAHEAKTHLSRLIDQVLDGEEVVIMRNEKPAVRLVRATPSKKGMRIGSMKGRVRFDESFFDPLPENETAGWGHHGA